MVSGTLLSRFYHTTLIKWPNLLGEGKDHHARKHASVAGTGFGATTLLRGGALGLASQTSAWVARTLVGLGSLALLLARPVRLSGQVQAVELRGFSQDSSNPYFVRGPPGYRGAEAGEKM